MIAWFVLLWACGYPASSPDPGEGGVFPHDDGYVEAHGVDALAAAASCADCHARTEDGPQGPGQACTSCHAYPHDGLSPGAVHGAAWEAEAADCVACHGEGGARAPAGAPRGQCTGCHATYPHPPEIEEASVHGAAALARGPDGRGCLGCHGPAPEPGPTCGSCHAAYPHPPDFLDGHGSTWRDDPEACGTGCHNRTDPQAPPACAQCHDLFPHPADWQHGHVAPVQTRGAVACTGCHPGDSLSGPAIPATCGGGCHASSLEEAP